MPDVLFNMEPRENSATGLNCQCRRSKRWGGGGGGGAVILGLERSPGGGSTPVFLPGESHGQRSLAGYIAQSWTGMKRLIRQAHLIPTARRRQPWS